MSANPEKRPGHDDANADPGNGASSPGDAGYDGERGAGADVGSGDDDLERKAAAGEDPAARYLGDQVTGDPAAQSDG
jgi:hypothetical protein